jgi:hypothetical protein
LVILNLEYSSGNPGGGAMTLSIMTLSKKCDIQHDNTLPQCRVLSCYYSAEYQYAECHYPKFCYAVCNYAEYHGALEAGPWRVDPSSWTLEAKPWVVDPGGGPLRGGGWKVARLRVKK